MTQHRPPRSDSLVLLAHGSTDVRHRRSLEVLTAAVACRVELTVRTAYLDHHGPDTGQVAARLVATGHRHTWVLPVFAARGYHYRVDVPLAMARMTDFGLQVDEVDPGLAGSPELVGAALTEPLGAGPLGTGPLGTGPLGTEQMGTEQMGGEPLGPGPTPARPVVLFAAGSADRGACAELARQAVGAARGPVAAAFLTGGPGLMQALASLPASGRRPTVLPFVVAAGTLRDRMAREAAALGVQLAAGCLSENPKVADLVARLINYQAAALV